VQVLLSTAISAFFLVVIFRSVDWQGAVQMLGRGVHWPSLLSLVIMAALIAAAYGFRWQMLSRTNLTYAGACRASILAMGGNMLLPARGGDLLRAHFTFVSTEASYAQIVSKLFVEKVIDLAALVALGGLALAVMGAAQASHAYSLMAGVLAGSVLLICAAVLMLKFGGERLLGILGRVFARMHRLGFFDRHVAPLVRDAGQTLSIRIMLPLGLLTLGMWLGLYAPAYIMAAKFVGVALSYREALFVLFAGALSLVIPAAPSGIGTFHASVVSAFALMGRSTIEGLLVAAAVHLLFFVMFVLPFGVVMWRWRFRRKVAG
jgi:uncharacterized membrane protein YbhN (UPF0104 family)